MLHNNSSVNNKGVGRYKFKRIQHETVNNMRKLIYSVDNNEIKLNGIVNHIY